LGEITNKYQNGTYFRKVTTNLKMESLRLGYGTYCQIETEPI